MISKEVPVSLKLPPSRIARSKGIHVSSIIRCIAQETGILAPEYYEELSLSDVREIKDPVAVLRMCIGLAWEEWYIPTLAESGVIDHPGEMKLSGIFLTHDAESLSVIITEAGTKTALVVHEVKSTYKSTRTVGDLSTEWMWLSQIKAYCKALGTRFAMIHVLFLCGDYGYPIKPVLKCWQLEFTQQEVDDNWQLLTEYVQDHQVGGI